jgi:hypothetical protein
MEFTLNSPEFTQAQLRLRADELDVIDAYPRDHKSPPSRTRAAEMLFRRP